MADTTRWSCRRRRRLRLLFVTAFAMATSVATSASTSGSGSVDCETASTVTIGSTNSQAIAYDSICNTRLFEVLELSVTSRSLNLSNLDVVRVDSYPTVYTMILNHNLLETFAPDATDNDMETLELASNRIDNLSSLNLPLRLTYLDLSNNAITSIPATAAWPEAAGLQTLLLDDNSLETIAESAFAPLVALQSLSLSNTGLASLDSFALPPSLRTLNATTNSFSSTSTNFSALPNTLEYLDLSDNLLTVVPSAISSLSNLVSLNLASNSIESVSAVSFPSTLTTLDLSDNPLTSFEACETDVAVLEALATFRVPSSVSGSCSDAAATLQNIQGVAVCVLPASSCVSLSSSSTSNSGDASSALTDVSGDEDGGSVFSSEAIGVIGSIAFMLGVIVSVLAVGLYRKRKRDDQQRDDQKRRAQTRSRGRSNLLSYARELEQNESQTDAEGVSEDIGKGGWIFDSPQMDLEDKYNPVALLEEDPHRKRKPGQLDDLLVYEIPPEEVVIKSVLGNTVDVHAPHGSKRAPRVMLLAEYQGFNVVVHALLRQKKPRRSDERRFIEQIRLASTLEHASIVHFIGLTYGSMGPTGGGDFDQVPTSNWSLGVIFEYMALGSLASMFQAERNRREGKQYYQNGSLSSTIGSGGGNIFSWYPVFTRPSGPPNPNSDWRCKLSLALDVAMGLVYLHSCGMVHGAVCAEKVLVNEHGEAKLNALDFELPSDLEANAHHHEADMRGSIRESAKRTMRRMAGLVPATSFSNSHSHNHSSFMRGAGVSATHAAALTPVTPTFAAPPAPPAENGPLWEATKRDVYSFGILLWELDTLISIESMKDLAPRGIGRRSGEEHQLLKFSGECPSELQFLARRCWSPSLKARPDAIDLQEELVRVLEGRLTTSTHVPSNWARPTNLSALSSFSSSNFSSRSSENSSSDAVSVVALSHADI